MTADPKMPQVRWGGVVYEKCVTCVDPAARPVGTPTATATAITAANRSDLRCIASSLSAHPGRGRTTATARGEELVHHRGHGNRAGNEADVARLDPLNSRLYAFVTNE